MGFFDTTEDSFKAAEDIPFKNEEVVGFQCTDFNENKTKKSLTLRCRVMTGEHKDKDCKIFLTRDDNEANLKRLRQFFLAFWTAEEVAAGQCKSAKLINRKFTAKCFVREGKNKDGSKSDKIFRNWGEFQDRGAGAEIAGAKSASAPQTQSQPAQAPVQPQTSAAGELSF